MPAPGEETRCPHCGVRLDLSDPGEELTSWMDGDPVAAAEKPPVSPRKLAKKKKPKEPPAPPPQPSLWRSLKSGCGLALVGLGAGFFIFVFVFMSLGEDVGELIGGMVFIACMIGGYAWGCVRFFEKAVYSEKGLAEIGSWMEGLLLGLAMAGMVFLLFVGAVVIIPEDSSLGPIALFFFMGLGLASIVVGFVVALWPDLAFSRRLRGLFCLPKPQGARGKQGSTSQ